jgi:hypothetical protein
MKSKVMWLSITVIVLGMVWLGCDKSTETKYTPNISPMVTIQPGAEGKDTYVCDCEPAENNPNGPESALYQGYVGPWGGCRDRLLIQFDLSSVPDNVTINTGRLQLYCEQIHGQKMGYLVYYRITEDWQETATTLATQPSYSEEDSVVSGFPIVENWLSVDITDWVQQWYQDASTNHGVYGHSRNASGSDFALAEFHSSDSRDSEKRPKLVVTYTRSE